MGMGLSGPNQFQPIAIPMREGFLPPPPNKGKDDVVKIATLGQGPGLHEIKAKCLIELT